MELTRKKDTNNSLIKELRDNIEKNIPNSANTS